MQRLGLAAFIAVLLAMLMWSGPASYITGQAGRAFAEPAQGSRQKEVVGKRKKKAPTDADAGVDDIHAAGDPTKNRERGPDNAGLSGREKIEADVSTRSVKVTSGFAGTEIIVFGSVDNSRQPSADAHYYDVAVVIEGLPQPLVARKKSSIAGLWINTDVARFESVPSYYAIASTRPVEEIADASLLEQYAIGLEYVRLSPAAKTAVETKAEDLNAFEQAVVRLKQKEGLYLTSNTAVGFIGRSLFRSSISLPANIPVGQLTARIYLFREGQLLSSFSTRVRLKREGIELWLYQFASRRPLLYGIFAVAVAVGAGLLASAGFKRRT